MDTVYEPQDDSFLFETFLKKHLTNQNIAFLDMGCGSCILANAAKECGVQDITCVDINKDAIIIAQKKGYTTYHSDLFEAVPHDKTFDVICYNAPYLPEDAREPQASQTMTTGGKHGDEIALRFLEQAYKHLKQGGTIYLLISSLTRQDRIQRYNPKVLATKQLFLESLYILELH